MTSTRESGLAPKSKLWIRFFPKSLQRCLETKAFCFVSEPFIAVIKFAMKLLVCCALCVQNLVKASLSTPSDGSSLSLAPPFCAYCDEGGFFLQQRTGRDVIAFDLALGAFLRWASPQRRSVEAPSGCCVAFALACDTRTNQCWRDLILSIRGYSLGYVVQAECGAQETSSSL